MLNNEIINNIIGDNIKKNILIIFINSISKDVFCILLILFVVICLSI